MHGCMDALGDECMDAWRDECMNAWMHGRMS